MATIATESDRFPASTKENSAGPAGAADPRPQPDSTLSCIPVVMHATHRSTAGGEANPVQKVREETETLIVFPTGAVVGLSSALSRGDLVVLTNRQNRADILCRVVFAWAATEGRNYIELEFAQRAPGFWEPEAAPATPGTSAVKAEAVTTTAPVLAPAIAPAIAPVLTFRPIAKVPAPLAPAPVAPAPSQQVLQAPAVEPSAAGPWMDSSTALPTENVASLRAAVAAAGADRTSGSSARTASKEPVDAGPRGLEHVASPIESEGQVTARLKALSHRPALWVIAACLTVAALFAEVYLTGHRGSSTPVAEGTTAQRSYPVQPASALASEALAYTQAHPAAATTPASAHDAGIAPELREAKTEPADDLRETTPASTPPRRSAVSVGKLSAPVGKVFKNGAPSEPPVMPAQANAVESLLATGSYATTAVPPTPAAAVPAANPAVRAGSDFQGPKLVSSTIPVYPPFARAQGQEGMVVIDALIDASGRVTEAKVVSGPFLLQQAALDAVRQWKYQPARLNGQPVANHQTINLAFKRQ